MGTDRAQARTSIDEAAAASRALFVEAELDAATDLLVEMYDAGERHGVAPDDWQWVTSLPVVCLDGISRRHRASIPQDEAGFVSVLEAMAARLGWLGVHAQRKGVDLVVLEPVATTPSWHGQFAVALDPNSGWCFVLFGRSRSPMVRVHAGFDVAGAAAVAEVAAKANAGELTKAMSDFR